MEDTVVTILASVAVGFMGIILTVLLMLFRLIGRTEANLRADMKAQSEGLNGEHEKLRADLNAKHDELRADLNAKHEKLRADLNAKHDELRADLSDVRVRLRNIEQDVAVLKSHALGLGPFFAERDARTRPASTGEAAPEPATAAAG